MRVCLSAYTFEYMCVCGRICTSARVWLAEQMFTTVQLRKGGTCLAFFLAATFLLLTGYAPTDAGDAKHVCVALLTLATASLGFGVASWNVNHVDLSPR